MSTTDILFNSPALHSLKRAQLVKLCKLHNVKASGKNTDLVTRLKRHARHLPPDTPLSIAVRSELSDFGEGITESEGATEDDTDDETLMGQRPSEMWEVVMDGIPEEDCDNKGCIGSKVALVGNSQPGGEFGTSGSSKSTLIRSIASSIGLKRSASSTSNTETLTQTESLNSLDTSKGSRNWASGSKKGLNSLFGSNSDTRPRDSLAEHAIPYKDIPLARLSQLPRTDPFTFTDYNGPDNMSVDSIDIPVPGIGGRMGVVVSDSSKMSSTIRLITSASSSAVNTSDDIPNLRPITPGFELIQPTPGRPGITKWPASPEKMETEERLYPRLEPEDLDMTILTSPSREKALQEPLSPSPDAVPKDAFVFGSPNPQRSSTAGDFSKAASSILAEMNARLGLAGGRLIDKDVLAHAPRSKLSAEEIMSYQFGGAQSTEEKMETDGSMSSRFDKVHEKEFARMDGIDTHYAARRGTKEPLNANNRKRKSNMFDKDTRSVKKSKSVAPAITPESKTIANVCVMPGAFEAEEDNEEEANQRDGVGSDDAEKEGKVRGAKRACVESGKGVSGESKRIAIAPSALNKISKAQDNESEEAKKKRNEAIKRHLALAKARRRSSRGHPSITGGRASIAAQKKKSGFGLLSTTKSIVKAVWNRGAGNPSSKITAKQETKSSVPSVTPPAAISSNINSTTTAARKSTIAPKTGARAFLGVRPAATRSSTIRSSSSSNTIGTGGTLRPKAKASLAPLNQQQRVASDSLARNSTPNTSTQPASNNDSYKADPGPNPVPGSIRAHKPSSATLTGTSRLTAPTASSLAKMNSRVASSGSKTNTITKPGTRKVPRARASAAVLSPSKIPVFSPVEKGLHMY